MGIFLVFFPEEENFNSSTTSSISPFKSSTIKGFLKRTNSSHILTRAQSTISICALLIFLTFLLFTLSSFEPNDDFISNHRNLHQYRRYLTQKNRLSFVGKPRSNSPPAALQGLGTLYARGTAAMNELVIGHVCESVTAKELKLFIRAFQRSGLAVKSDLLFVFDSISSIDSFDELIREENELFFKVIRRYSSEFGNGSGIGDFRASFNVTRFVKSGRDSGKGDPIWGRKMKGSNNSSFDGDNNNGTESTTQTNYGSVVGFGIGELDPENSLSGFIDPVPMSLRRWASYPMILGRVRRKFKKVILVDVKEVLLLGDPLGRAKSHSAESIIFSSTPTPPPKHGRKAAKPHRKAINPALILGGERGVRRLAAAMLTEIVHATTTRQQHGKKKASVTESVLLSQLAGNEFLQKSIRFSAESIQQEPSSLGVGVELANLTVVVRRGNSNFDIGEVMMKHICSFPIESSVYNTEC